MICNETVRRFCCDDISTIENYDKAMTDMEHTWDCHHMLEVGANGELISRNDLIDHGLYYDRPASELIFLTKREHRILHKKGVPRSEEVCRKMSERQKGVPKSEEQKDKIRKTLTGTHQSIETCMKRSESMRKWWARRKMAG